MQIIAVTITVMTIAITLMKTATNIFMRKII